MVCSGPGSDLGFYSQVQVLDQVQVLGQVQALDHVLVLDQVLVLVLNQVQVWFRFRFRSGSGSGLCFQSEISVSMNHSIDHNVGKAISSFSPTSEVKTKELK